MNKMYYKDFFKLFSKRYLIRKKKDLRKLLLEVKLNIIAKNYFKSL